MAVIKFKKAYFKKAGISKEQAKEFFKTTERLFGLEGENSLIAPLYERYGLFPHPETDIWDDAVGIEPKRCLKLDQTIGFEQGLSVLAWLLKGWPTETRRAWWDSEVEAIDWDLAAKKLLKALDANPEKPFTAGMASIGLDAPAEEEALQRSWERGISISEILRIEEKKEEWQKIRGFVPRSEALLFAASPERFGNWFPKAVKNVFGKAFVDLDEVTQVKVARAVNAYGENLGDLPEKFLLSAPDPLWETGTLEKTPLKALLEVEGVTSVAISAAIHAHTLWPEVNEEFKNPGLGTIRWLGFLSQVCFYYYGRPEDELFKALRVIGVSGIKAMARYGVESSDIPRLVEIWEERSDANLAEEISDIHIDGYTGRFLAAGNADALLLGYATDCCQVAGSNGESCLLTGVKYDNSGFFAVYNRKGRIVAQSWVWETQLDDGKRVFVFDSIEVLGKDLDKSKNVLDIYREAAQTLVDEGDFDLVVASWDANRAPKGLQEAFGGVRYIPEILENRAFPGVYTDLQSDVVVMAEGGDE